MAQCVRVNSHFSHRFAMLWASFAGSRQQDGSEVTTWQE